MTPERRWHRAALGALALVIATVALGVILEHTVGSGWAGGGGTKGPIAIPHARFDPSAKRIPAGIRQQLLEGRRLGARYGGSNFSNVGGVGKAVVVQLGIGGVVVALMIAWRRMHPRSVRPGRGRSRRTRDA